MLRDLRRWLEDSAVEEPQARSSHEPLHPEPPPKVVSGKHSTFTHFPNDRNCEVCKKDQNYEVSFKKTNWRNSTSSGKVGHLIAADHKFSTRRVNRGTITEYTVVVQELSSQLMQSYPSKTIFSGNRKELAKVLGAG